MQFELPGATGGQERTINEREKETAAPTSPFLAAFHVVSAHAVQQSLKSQLHVGNSEEGGQIFQYFLQWLCLGTAKMEPTLCPAPLGEHSQENCLGWGKNTIFDVFTKIKLKCCLYFNEINDIFTINTETPDSSGGKLLKWQKTEFPQLFCLVSFFFS